MGYSAEHSTKEPARAGINAISGPLLVEFGAPWCPHCIEVQETLADLLGKHPEVRHIKVYDGKGKPLGRSFRVKLWPNLVFMRDGKVMKQMARPSEAEILDSFKLFTAAAPTPECGLP